MRRASFVAAAAGAAAVAALPKIAIGMESEYRLETTTGTIDGSLESVAASPAPVVLIVAGSGPTDRNGNSPRYGLMTDAYKLLAADLARENVASLRYDKRGIGASSAAMASEESLTFDTYVNDAADWLRRLRADGRFSKIVIAGHSEGSLVAMIAAQRAPADAFVSLEGAGRPIPVVLREQLKPKLSAELYAQADAIISSLQKGKRVADIPSDLMVLFRPSVQPYLISWFKYDPAVEIAKLRIPLTIVQGTADVQVTMNDAQALHAAAPSSRLLVVEGMNHVLKYSPDVSSPAAIAKAYADPSLPIDPQVTDTIVAAAGHA